MDISLPAGGMRRSSMCKTMAGSVTKREASQALLVDAACTLAVWGMNVVAWVGTYEVIHALSSISLLEGHRDVRLVVTGTVGVMVWMLLVSMLMVAFKWAVIGSFRTLASNTGAGEVASRMPHSGSEE